MSALIRQHNLAVVEDDPYVDLRFMGTSAPALRHYLGDRLVTLGSFSKIVSPGLRLGWMVAAPEIMVKVNIMKQATDLHTSQFAQRVLYQYLVDNDVDAHIVMMCGVYKHNRDCMLAAIKKYFPPDVTYTQPEGGMFMWCTLPSEADAMALFEVAIREKVAFVPGPIFFTDGSGKNPGRTPGRPRAPSRNRRESGRRNARGCSSG